MTQCARMTRGLFTWKKCNRFEFLNITYIDCTVVSAFGPFAAGDKIPEIDIDYAFGDILAYPESKQAPWRGKLTLTVEAA